MMRHLALLLVLLLGCGPSAETEEPPQESPKAVAIRQFKEIVPKLELPCGFTTNEDFCKYSLVGQPTYDITATNSVVRPFEGVIIFSVQRTTNNLDHTVDGVYANVHYLQMRYAFAYNGVDGSGWQMLNAQFRETNRMLVTESKWDRWIDMSAPPLDEFQETRTKLEDIFWKNSSLAKTE